MQSLEFRHAEETFVHDALGQVRLRAYTAKERQMTSRFSNACAGFVILLLICGGGGAPVAQAQQPIWGFADLHAHLASHLAFGGDGTAFGSSGIFWGQPGQAWETADLTLPVDLMSCSPDTHTGADWDPVRHLTRGILIDKLFSDIPVCTKTGCGSPTHAASGSPGFTNWPSASSVAHQQMHVKALKRAYDAGLRLLFASTHDNEILTDLWHVGYNYFGNSVPTPDPSFAMNSAIRQLTFIQNFVAANSTWMQIVSTPTEARAAISSNPPKLAVILSVEMDSLSSDQIFFLVNNYSVRHVIPIHFADNSFGGTAVHNDLFNTLNYFLNGEFFKVTPDACLSFRLGKPSKLSSDWQLLWPIPIPILDTAIPLTLGSNFIEPDPIDDNTYNALGYAAAGCGGPNTACIGHRNAKGLNRAEFLKLMSAGLLLDLAHMGQQSAEDALSLAEEWVYPLMDSHTGLRNDAIGSPPGSQCPGGPSYDNGDKTSPFTVSERSLPFSQAIRLAKLGGVIGLGTGGQTVHPSPVDKWITDYNNAVDKMYGPYSPGKGVALGTDLNDFQPQIAFDTINTSGDPSNPSYTVTVVPAMKPPGGVSTTPLPQFTMGSKTYDFSQDGIAHYGMLADFMQALYVRAGTSKYRGADAHALRALTGLYNSAEDVIEMWEKVEVARGAIPSPDASSGALPCTTSLCTKCKKDQCDPGIKECMGQDGPPDKSVCARNLFGCVQHCAQIQACPGKCCGTPFPDGTCIGECVGRNDVCGKPPLVCGGSDKLKCCGYVGGPGVWTGQCYGDCIPLAGKCPTPPACSDNHNCCGGIDANGKCTGPCIALGAACPAPCPAGGTCCTRVRPDGTCATCAQRGSTCAPPPVCGGLICCGHVVNNQCQGDCVADKALCVKGPCSQPGYVCCGSVDPGTGKCDNICVKPGSTCPKPL
jgi:microsomal dipeptidase-like Zn-dependent dipeptidase